MQDRATSRSIRALRRGLGLCAVAALGWFAASGPSPVDPMATGGPTGAVERSGRDQGGAPLVVGFAMTEGEEVRGPRGYYALCAREPQDCPAPIVSEGPARLQLNESLWRLLSRVNARINAAHTPMTDQDAHGTSDHWALPLGVADCEDYALAKRAALVAAGAAPEALLIGVVEGVETAYHAVLIVRTDRGDLVLDNLDPEIRTWTGTPYAWVIRQSERDPARWVRITGARDPGRESSGERTIRLRPSG